jgi:hypothetical protein
MSACMTALKRAAPPTSATSSAPNREMKAEAGAEVNSAVRDAGRAGVTRTPARADLERALPLIAIPILGAASSGFVLHARMSCKWCTSMSRRTLNLKKGA